MMMSRHPANIVQQANFQIQMELLPVPVIVLQGGRRREDQLK